MVNQGKEACVLSSINQLTCDLIFAILEILIRVSLAMIAADELLEFLPRSETIGTSRSAIVDDG